MTQYAYFDSTAAQPTAVLGWYDTTEFDYPNLPASADMLELTALQWASRMSQAWYIDSGSLVNPPPVTLAQAQTAQNATLRQSYNRAIATAPVVVNGTDYTLATDVATQLNAYLSAQQALASPAWAANTAVTVGQIVTVSGTPLFCSAAGTTGSSAPTAPTEIGTPVTDGTASWELFARSAELSNGAFAWFTAAEIVSVGQQIELFLHTQKSTLIGLLAEVAAQTAVPETPVTWP